jgi:hypothetical protein
MNFIDDIIIFSMLVYISFKLNRKGGLTNKFITNNV